MLGRVPSGRRRLVRRVAATREEAPVERRHRRPALPRLGMPAPPFEAETTRGTTSGWRTSRGAGSSSSPTRPTSRRSARPNSSPSPGSPRRCGSATSSCSASPSTAPTATSPGCGTSRRSSAWRSPSPSSRTLDREVATRYGMVMPGESRTETSRCVFVIDPSQIVRAMIYYPLTDGPEHGRDPGGVVDALQTTDTHGARHAGRLAARRPGDPAAAEGRSRGPPRGV